jgi:hypothetical protein
MKNQFPASDKCDFCENKYTKETDDGATLCDQCFKEDAILCVGCGESMAWSVSIYRGEDGKCRCQLCDQDNSHQA